MRQRNQEPRPTGLLMLFIGSMPKLGIFHSPTCVALFPLAPPRLVPQFLDTLDTFNQTCYLRHFQRKILLQPNPLTLRRLSLMVSPCYNASTFKGEGRFKLLKTLPTILNDNFKLKAYHNKAT